MATHYEIHETTERGEFRLVTGPFAKQWAGVKNEDFRPMTFDTSGGARNYMHKHGFRKGCRVVRVSEGVSGK